MEGSRRQHERVPDDGRVGRKAHVRGIDAQQHVVHARVADDGHLVDPLGKHAGAPQQLVDLLVQEADDAALELPQIRRVPLSEGDPRHQVAAERRLGVQARDRRHHLARGELEKRGDHARRADVDRDPERHRGGVAALDAERRALERDDRHLALALAERGRERADHVEGDVHGREAGRQRELLEIRGLVVLLLRQLDPDDLLADPGVHGHLRPDNRARLDAQDLERALVEGRRDLDDERLHRHQLAGEAVSLAHQVVAELKLVADRAGRGHALDDLDPAGRAAAAPAAGGRDVHSLGVRRAEQSGAGLDGDRPAIRQKRHGDGGHVVILDHGEAGNLATQRRLRPSGADGIVGPCKTSARRPAASLP